MATYRDTAVVLRVGKLGEADRIVTLLTRRFGRVRAVAKGVRRTKSRFGGRLEPFNHVDVQLYEGRSLDTVTQAVSLDPFGAGIAADYARYTAATVIAETADRLVGADRQPWLRLYLLVVPALRALVQPVGEPVDAPDALPQYRDPGLVMDAFLLRAMALAGWAPALTECARCAAPGPHSAFHVPSGGLLCTDCRGGGFARPATATVALMNALATGDWTGAEASGVEPRRESAGLVAALVQFHLERGLKSLPLVDRSAGMTAMTRLPVDVARDEQPTASVLAGTEPADGLPSDPVLVAGGPAW